MVRRVVDMSIVMWLAGIEPSSTLDTGDQAANPHPRRQLARVAVPSDRARKSLRCCKLLVMPGAPAIRRDRACAEVMEEMHAIIRHEGFTTRAACTKCALERLKR